MQDNLDSTLKEKSTGDSSDSEVVDNSKQDDPTKAPKPSRLIKVLPTRKVSSVKQFDILKGFAIASGQERKPVTIKEIANITNIHQGSVSICNPFFTDIGLIQKQGHKFLPSKEVFDYLQSSKWDKNKAGNKLRPLIEKTWFANEIVSRLQLRTISEEDAIQIFAEKSGASPDYRTQLIMLIDFLELSGLVWRDNGVLSQIHEGDHGEQHSDKGKEEGEKKNKPDISDIESFEIPIPGKSPAHIVIPKGLDDSDWEMLTTMLEAYIARLKKNNLG